MNFEVFRARAEEIFEDIPPDYREGVDGLEVLRKTVPHPTLPDIYTLGECLSEFYPSDYGGPGEVLSRVFLYYGSFLELSRTHDDWDWEGELFETITHEVRHHLEHLAAEDALEEMDYAEDQNFARREGERFDPFFYRAGHQREKDLFEVDGDWFLEREASGRWLAANPLLSVDFLGRRFDLRVPSERKDVHFLRLPSERLDLEGEGFVVLIRRKGLVEWVGGALKGAQMEVVEIEAELEAET
jgi:Zincin-like metallopeptidase